MQLKDDTVPAGQIETADLDKACPRCNCKKGEIHISWEKKRFLFWWISIPKKVDAYTKTTLNIDVDGEGPVPPVPVTYYKCLKCGWNRMIAGLPDIQEVIDAVTANKK